MSPQDKANFIAALVNQEGFKVVMEHLETMLEAHRNECENPTNVTLQYSQGKAAAYRDVLNFIKEKIKEANNGL